MKNKRRTLKLLSTILCLAFLVGAFSSFSVSAVDDIPDWEDYTTGDTLTFGNIEYVTRAHLTEKYHYNRTNTSSRTALCADAIVGKQPSADRRFAGVYASLRRSNNTSCEFFNCSLDAWAKTRSGLDLMPANQQSLLESGGYIYSLEASIATRSILRVTGSAWLTCTCAGSNDTGTYSYFNNNIVTDEY